MTSERRPRAVTEAMRFRAQLLREEAPVLREMVLAMRRLVDSLEADMIAVGERLAKQASLGRVSPGAVVEFGEYVALRRAAEAALLRYTGGVELQVAALQRLRIEQAIEHTRILTEAALPPGLTFDVLAGLGRSWAVLDPAALEHMVGRMRDGSSVRRYLDARVVEGTQQRMAEVLTDGIVRNPRETARLLRGTFSGGAVQSLRVARTETLRVYRDVARESYQRNSNVVRGYRRQASLDDRTCFACWVLDGTLYQNESDMEEHVQGRCFTVPVTVTWAELGIRGMDEPEREPTGRQRFERLPEAQQRRIVGNDRQYDAWKSGTIGLADMVARHTHPTFGAQLVQASARQSLAGAGLTRLPGPDEALSTGAALLRPTG